MGFHCPHFAEKSQQQTLMARSLQLLSLVLSRARASALCPLSTFTLTCARFFSERPNQPWPRYSQRAWRQRDETPLEESELEDVEDKIQAVIDKEVKRQRKVKYHIIKRKMTPPGPLERKLTWDAMEQIRYLKQEQPEEWTVERLAEGFSVSKEIIFRVLKSKFTPSLERKAKQDAKVMAKLAQQVLSSGPRAEQEKQRLSSGPQAVQEKQRLTSGTRAALSSGIGNHALIPIGHQSLIPQTQQYPAALSVTTKYQFSEITKQFVEMPQEEIQQSTESAEIEEDEYWDGQIFSEEDIEEFITMKAPPVVQEGSEFFDAYGNFLYKI